MQSFITRQNEPEAAKEVKPKRIFPFLKRGQGLERFRMSSNDLATQRKRVSATTSKKKSPSVENIGTKTAVPSRADKCLKAKPGKSENAPVNAKLPAPKKVNYKSHWPRMSN